MKTLGAYLERAQARRNNVVDINKFIVNSEN